MLIREILLWGVSIRELLPKIYLFDSLDGCRTMFTLEKHTLEHVHQALFQETIIGAHDAIADADALARIVFANQAQPMLNMHLLYSSIEPMYERWSSIVFSYEQLPNLEEMLVCDLDASESEDETDPSFEDDFGESTVVDLSEPTTSTVLSDQSLNSESIPESQEPNSEHNIPNVSPQNHEEPEVPSPQNEWIPGGNMNENDHSKRFEEGLLGSSPGLKASFRFLWSNIWMIFFYFFEPILKRAVKHTNLYASQKRAEFKTNNPGKEQNRKMSHWRK
jgi:hypothetical protein